MQIFEIKIPLEDCTTFEIKDYLENSLNVTGIEVKEIKNN